MAAKVNICIAKRHVRLTPESGHMQCTRLYPLLAKSGHRLMDVMSCQTSSEVSLF